MTDGPEVHADRVVFRLEDRGYTAVRLQQELERPRNGPALTCDDGHWQVAFRRAQVDRMEYRFEVDGERLCDPCNPLQTPDGNSVVEFPGYRPPAWLSAPDPGPSVALGERARLWSPPDCEPRRPLPLLVALDGSEYERQAELPRLIADAIARNRVPPCRVVLLDAAERVEEYSASARHTRTLVAQLPRLAPSTAHAGLGARIGALALLHAHWLHPGAFGALFLTCGAPEENLANNRAVAGALRRQGHDVALYVNRDAHNYVGWRDTLDPHLIDLLGRAWG